jgi:hypothetical protein
MCRAVAMERNEAHMSNTLMSLAGFCASARILVLNYGATNVAPSQKTNPSSRRRRDPISKHVNSLGTNRS